MGCAPSKQSVCRNCNAQFSPVRRSYVSYTHHSPPREGYNSEVVGRTSTTLGYLLLEQSKLNQVRQDPAVAESCHEPVRRNVPAKKANDCPVEFIDAKTWSKMIDEKTTKIMPKTPIRTPPGEPETINSWELMEGLDDSSPILLQDSNSNSDDTIITSEFDPKPVNLTPPENQPSSNTIGDHSNKPLQNGKKDKEKLILYFTSLRGVRKTYEDCCHVRVILKSSGVRVDERDVSMHSGFKEELKELLGDEFGGGGGLPKVFVGKKYMGGADEIRRLHDEFRLEKALEGCEMADEGGGNGGEGGGCGACGDIRFLPCDTCSGSCKIYNDVNFGEEKKEEESDYGFQRCPYCNENGLIRCPICCD